MPALSGLFADDFALQGPVFKELWNNHLHSMISSFSCSSSSSVTAMIASFQKLQTKYDIFLMLLAY